MNNEDSGRTSLRILHIEDSQLDAEIIRERLIDAGFSLQIDWASNEQEFTKFLQGGSYDLILADYRLPGFNAPAALKLAQMFCPGVPFVCVSGAIGEENAVELLKQGATDYVLKDRLDKLPLTIQRALDEIASHTARRQAEEALQGSKEQHRSILQTAMDGFWLIDMQGRLQEVNETYCRMSGYSAQELLSMRISDLEATEETADTAARITKIVALGEDRFETRHRRKDGSIFVVEVSVQFRNVKDGQLVAFIRDITEHRKLEEQLRQSQKMEAIGQLAGGVAHDFNNILTVILGYCELLNMRPKLDAAEKDALLHISSAAEKAAQLTRGLLAFSRKQVMDQKPVNLNDVVQQVQKFLVRIIGEDIKLKAIYNDATLNVMADTGQIEQVLVNLATNARDAMPEGGALTIETGLQEIDDAFVFSHGWGKPGRYGLLSVSDNGIGMTEEVRKKIFEPFFTTKDIGKGTGLGMAIVHGIITQHNGFVSVYSEPGRGTTFKIFIPLIDKDELSHFEELVAQPPKGGTETILVAEDDAAVREVVEMALTTAGYQVIIAEDGQEAIDTFKQNRSKIKLILMDLIMPKLNGIEAFKEIQLLQSDIKVLFSSGYSADFIRSRVDLHKSADLIMKPVKPTELLRKLREMLDR